MSRKFSLRPGAMNKLLISMKFSALGATKQRRGFRLQNRFVGMGERVLAVLSLANPWPAFYRSFQFALEKAKAPVYSNDTVRFNEGLLDILIKINVRNRSYNVNFL